MKYQNNSFYPETPWHLIRVLWCILTLMLDMFVLTNTYPEGETDHSWTLVSEKESEVLKSSMGKCRKFTLPKGVTASEYRCQTKSWYRSFGEGLVHGVLHALQEIHCAWWLSCGKAGLQMLCSLYIFRNKDQMMIPRDISRVWLWFVTKAATRLRWGRIQIISLGASMKLQA